MAPDRLVAPRGPASCSSKPVVSVWADWQVDYRRSPDRNLAADDAAPIMAKPETKSRAGIKLPRKWLRTRDARRNTELGFPSRTFMVRRNPPTFCGYTEQRQAALIRREHNYLARVRYVRFSIFFNVRDDGDDTIGIGALQLDTETELRDVALAAESSAF